MCSDLSARRGNLHFEKRAAPLEFKEVTGYHIVKNCVSWTNTKVAWWNMGSTVVWWIKKACERRVSHHVVILLTKWVCFKLSIGAEKTSEVKPVFPHLTKMVLQLHLSPLPTLLSHTLRSLLTKDMDCADQCTSEYGAIDLERAAQSEADFISDVQSIYFPSSKGPWQHFQFKNHESLTSTKAHVLTH